MKALGIIVLLVTYVSLVDADCFLSNPKGSNNRLSETSAQRRNNDRVFDSQNNGRGGYNVGDKTAKAAGNNASLQYQMRYIMSPLDPVLGESIMNIEWTNQHGCGSNNDSDPNKLNCNIVIQFMCQPETEAGRSEQDEMRDGTNRETNEYKEPEAAEDSYAAFKERKDARVKADRAVQERFEWYDKCNKRKRNEGLFTADQKLEGKTSKYTRQNNNGQRRGYECPEERDYYPYWHPTPWKDIHVLAERADRCEFYQKNSFNVKPKHECVEEWKTADPSKPPKHYSEFNNQSDCEKAGHKWLEFHNYLEILEHDEPTCKQKNGTDVLLNGRLIWERPLFHVAKKCLVRLEEPKCEVAPYSRVNHLGNGMDLEALKVRWKIPAFPSQKKQKCILRIRYNISTDDYDNTNTNNDQTLGDVYLFSGQRTKSLGDFQPLPKSNGNGKMDWAKEDDGKFKAGEYIIYEKLKDGKKSNQWIGFQDAFFRKKYLRYSFSIKFLGSVPPPSANFGFKVLDVLYNDWVKTCEPDKWCYVEKIVRAKKDGDRDHVILIFDHITTKRKIYVAELKVEVYIPPIENDPIVNIGNIGQGLRLAINTAQFGRTFQDRTHIFFLEHDDIFKNGETLHVVQVRGKRGNIVQTFPAVEYDFFPTEIVMREMDMLHLTWTGSNTHLNGGPAGDGQAGNDGQGTAGTDRNNICSVSERDVNYPLHADNPKNLCQNIREIVWSHYPVNKDFEEAKLDVCIQLMSGGYYWCFKNHTDCKLNSLFTKETMNPLLNNSPASFPGVIVKLNAGVYHYISTRNNNFSNRSQKGTITVVKA